MEIKKETLMLEIGYILNGKPLMRYFKIVRNDRFIDDQLPKGVQIVSVKVVN